MSFLMGFEERCRESVELQYFTFGLGFGFRFGVDDERQDKKIEQLEKRIDELEEREQPADPAI